MSATTIKLDTKRLDAITRGLKKNVDEVLTDFAFQIEGEAKMLAPVDTSALKNSIYVVSKEGDGYAAASSAAKAMAAGRGKSVETAPHPYPNGQVIARVGPCVDYAAAVEMGHLTKAFTKSQGCQRFVAAQPYLMPAVEIVSRRFNDPNKWKEVFI